MPASNSTMIHRLQAAINGKGERLLIDRSQFYSKDQDRPITMYKVCKMAEKEGGKDKKEKLFESASMIQIVLYLRDYWFMLNGWEIPKDNEEWNKIKQVKGIVFEGQKDG